MPLEKRRIHFMRFISFLILLPSFFFASNIRHIYLTWQKENTSNNITLNIHALNNIDELEVFYDSQSRKDSDNAYSFKTKAKGKHFIKDRYIFHIELSNLEPGTIYYFSIKSKIDGFSEERKFKTIPQNFDSLRLVEGGDWEQPNEAIKLCEIAAKYNPDAVLLGGDYPDEVLSVDDYRKWDMWLDSYCKTMITENGVLIPMILAIGNHDVVGGFGQTYKNSPFFFKYFPQTNNDNESFFIKYLGKDIVLIVLDSGHCYDYAGKQYEWLKKKLKLTKDIPIKLALYHVPIFPSVRFPNENLSYRILHPLAKISHKNIDFSMLLCSQSYLGKKYWLPLFDKYQLTAAFEHHDHTLKRTKPIRFGMIHPYGTVYLGDGGWSPKIQCSPLQSYLSGYFAKCSSHLQFFWLIDIKKDKICYKAISKNNQIIDEYIQKIKKMN